MTMQSRADYEDALANLRSWAAIGQGKVRELHVGESHGQPAFVHASLSVTADNVPRAEEYAAAMASLMSRTRGHLSMITSADGTYRLELWIARLADEQDTALVPTGPL